MGRYELKDACLSCKTWSFMMQKAAFGIVKDRLLAIRRNAESAHSSMTSCQVVDAQTFIFAQKYCDFSIKCQSAYRQLRFRRTYESQDVKPCASFHGKMTSCK